MRGGPGIARPARMAQDTEELQAGLDAAITVEAACVTFVGVARQRAVEGGLELDPDTVRFLRASQCEDEAHYHFLASLGAAETAAAYSIPERGLADGDGFLETLIALEAISVGAYMAAARRLAELGEARLVEIAYQMGAVDAQHEALARHLLGVRPANDRAFAKRRFVDLAEAADALATIGFVGGGETYAFPGPVDRLCRGVFGLVPETTEDALIPPPAVGTPVATRVTVPEATPVP